MAVPGGHIVEPDSERGSRCSDGKGLSIGDGGGWHKPREIDVGVDVKGVVCQRHVLPGDRARSSVQEDLVVDLEKKEGFGGAVPECIRCRYVPPVEVNANFLGSYLDPGTVRERNPEG